MFFSSLKWCEGNMYDYVKYLNYVSMSIIAIFNMLWLGREAIFADIPGKNQISPQVLIY